MGHYVDEDMCKVKPSIRKTSAIVCVAPDGGIGDFKGNLLYVNKQDMAFFCGFTQGKICLVGYNTYKTLPPLHGREVVLDDRNSLHNIKDTFTGKDVVVIGGSKTYDKYSSQIDELYVTKMVKNPHLAGESFFNFENFEHLKYSEVIMSNKDFTITRYFK